MLQKMGIGWMCWHWAFFFNLAEWIHGLLVSEKSVNQKNMERPSNVPSPSLDRASSLRLV